MARRFVLPALFFSVLALVFAAVTPAATHAQARVAPPAHVIATHRDRPPECVTVPLHQSAGTAYLVFCGGAGGQESPLQSWAPSGNLVIDGFSRLVSPSKCPKSSPCVILAENAPPS